MSSRGLSAAVRNSVRDNASPTIRPAKMSPHPKPARSFAELINKKERPEPLFSFADCTEGPISLKA